MQKEYLSYYKTLWNVEWHKKSGSRRGSKTENCTTKALQFAKVFQVEWLKSVVVCWSTSKKILCGTIFQLASIQHDTIQHAVIDMT